MKQNDKRAIVVIDFVEHPRGGHFGFWLTYFSREFASRFDKVLVCTPNTELTAQLFQSAETPLPENVQLAAIPFTRRGFFSSRIRKSSLGDIFRDAKKLAPGHKISGFIMWADDLLEDNRVENKSRAPWGTLGTLSWEQRIPSHKNAAQDRRVRELCQNAPDCVRIMTPDDFIVTPKLEKSLWIPAMQNLALQAEPIPELVELNRRAAGRPVVGATGILFGYRCVNEMVRLSLEHPELFFFMAGKLVRDTVQPELLRKLDVEKPENLMVMEGFLEEPKLNAVINAMDLVLLDGTNYPVHSSIVVKALHFGKFILSPESNSWTCDAIKKSDVGTAYSNRNQDFKELWTRWKNSGGPERSRNAARSMMSPAALAACFDEISEALIHGGK